jgi:hypothetical protein
MDWQRLGHLAVAVISMSILYGGILGGCHKLYRENSNVAVKNGGPSQT